MSNEQLMRAVEIMRDKWLSATQNEMTTISQMMRGQHLSRDEYLRLNAKTSVLTDQLSIVKQLDLSAIVASVTAESGQQPVQQPQLASVTCQICEGAGYIYVHHHMKTGPHRWVTTPCDHCDGTGWATLMSLLSAMQARKDAQAKTYEITHRVAQKRDESSQLIKQLGKNFNDRSMSLGMAYTIGRQNAIQPGWKLVPMEPTEEMLVFGQEAWAHAQRDRNAVEDCVEATNVYAAMLAAAPEYKGE